MCHLEFEDLVIDKNKPPTFLHVNKAVSQWGIYESGSARKCLAWISNPSRSVMTRALLLILKDTNGRWALWIHHLASTVSSNISYLVYTSSSQLHSFYTLCPLQFERHFTPGLLVMCLPIGGSVIIPPPIQQRIHQQAPSKNSNLRCESPPIYDSPHKPVGDGRVRRQAE